MPDSQWYPVQSFGKYHFFLTEIAYDNENCAIHFKEIMIEND